MAKELESKGRPFTYDKELVAPILERVSGGETLRAVCRDLKTVPESTFRLWVVYDHDGLAAQYARARQAQAESWSDEILDIADDGSRDTTTKTGRDGEQIEVCDHEWINRSRLKVDTRKWLMAKLHPKAYGDKVEHDLSKDTTDTLTALIQGIRSGNAGK